MTTEIEQCVELNTVTVYVNPGQKPEIVCDPKWLYVKRPVIDDKRVTLTFNLNVPAGYEQEYTFPTLGGIVIVNEAFPDPCTTSQEASLPPVNITSVNLVDVNKHNGDYIYRAVVLERNGETARVLTADPYIRNGP